MKKLHNMMIFSLIFAIIALCVDLGLGGIITPKVDNILHLGDSVKNFDMQIDNLQRETDKINTYTKQYKKRVDYGNNTTSSEARDYEDSIIEEIEVVEIPPIEPKKPEIEYSIPKDTKPKLVIIIDDIATKKQLDDLKKIDLKLTPSVFPVSQKNKEMIKAVNELDFFMLHLPLEANKYNDELDTIKISDSDMRIETKISAIKNSLPSIKYINNHTGSKFTASKAHMQRLLAILDKNNITFVDSRTTADSALNAIAKEQHRIILYRDIFIDNNLNAESLARQLKEGVKLAKDRGYAILIAHPHKESFRAIKLASQDILKEVEVIYLDELDKILQQAHIKQYAQKILQRK